MQKIAKASANTKNTSQAVALTKIREFFMDYPGPNQGRNIHGHTAFALMPSMRVLSGNSIVGEAGFDWPLDMNPGGTNITEINFSHSAIDSDTFESLLSRISAPRYIRSLEKHAASSLESLDTSSQADDRWILDNDGEQPSMRSFAEFTTLEIIRLEDKAFKNPEEGDQAWIWETLPEEPHQEDGKAANPGPPRGRLADTPPSTVKYLNLLRNRNHNAKSRAICLKAW